MVLAKDVLLAILHTLLRICSSTNNFQVSCSDLVLLSIIDISQFINLYFIGFLKNINITLFFCDLRV